MVQPRQCLHAAALSSSTKLTCFFFLGGGRQFALSNFEPLWVCFQWIMSSTTHEDEKEGARITQKPSRKAEAWFKASVKLKESDQSCLC